MRQTTFEGTIFIWKNVRINIKSYLYAYAVFHKLKNKSIQTGLKYNRFATEYIVPMTYNYAKVILRKTIHLLVLLPIHGSPCKL